MSDIKREGQEELAGRVVAGTDSAAMELDQAFRARLCALVGREMDRRYQRREDPEDVAQSVFRTFFRRNAAGEFRFDHDGALWKLLQKIARRKILKHVEFHQAQARDPAREEHPDDVRMVPGVSNEVTAHLLGDALEIVLEGVAKLDSEVYRLQLNGYSVGEVVETILRGLEHPYPEILRLRLQGHSENEIAAQLGCAKPCGIGYGGFKNDSVTCWGNCSRRASHTATSTSMPIRLQAGRLKAGRFADYTARGAVLRTGAHPVTTP